MAVDSGRQDAVSSAMRLHPPPWFASGAAWLALLLLLLVGSPEGRAESSGQHTDPASAAERGRYTAPSAEGADPAPAGTTAPDAAQPSTLDQAFDLPPGWKPPAAQTAPPPPEPETEPQSAKPTAEGPDAAPGTATPALKSPPQEPAREPQPAPAPPEQGEAAAQLEGAEAETEKKPSAAAPEEPALPREAATYREEESPLVFRVPVSGKDPRGRAKEAADALSDVLDRSDEGGKPRVVTVRIEDGVAVVRIGEYLVTTLYQADAAAEGMSLENYAQHLEGKLRAWVSSQLQRKAIQLFVLHVFLSVFFGVLGFLTLRFLRTAFDRWDESLDDKRGSLQPISILRIPVISGEALGGSLAFGLAVGRVTAYVATVIATIAAILGQFDFTRPLLHRLVGWSAGPILRGVETVVSAIPGLILAAGLFVGARAGLRVLNLLLDGVASKRIVWKRLPPPRVPVFRVVASAVVVLVMAPLLVAAAFGRFGTPLEFLALGIGGVVLVANVPQLASYAVGVIMLWRDTLRPGDWVQVGSMSGEVTRVSLGEVSLVPEGGGTIGVPMLYLLLHPLHRLREPPAVCIDVTVARDRPAKELIHALRSAAVAAEPDAKVECIDICHAWLKLRVSAPAVRDGVRQQLLVAVSDAVDRHEFELPTLHGPVRE